MAEKKMSRHERMYKTKPTLERGEDGHIGVKEKEADNTQAGVDKVAGTGLHEGMPMHIRHAHERNDMHTRHEVEHSVHDHAKLGSKKEMHSRHESELKSMHKRHESEIESGEHKDIDIKEGHETGKDQSASVTKEAKKE
jgi:hypothetical protein